MMIQTAAQGFKVAANIYTAFLVEKDGFKSPELKCQKVILMDQGVILHLARDDQINRTKLTVDHSTCTKKTELFYRTYGQITDFEIHASIEYVVVVTDAGHLYVFHLKNGDIRAKVTIEPNLKSVKCDFSGLFAAVTTKNNTVKLYEIETGIKVYDLDPQMTEVSLGFSSDCRYLAVSEKSALKFYLLDEVFVSKARRIVQSMHADPLTWQKMPVKLA